MVRVTDNSFNFADGSIDIHTWIEHLTTQYPLTLSSLIVNACTLSQLTGEDHPTETGESCLQQGLVMAEILADLELDETTLSAAIILQNVQYAELSISDVREQLGENIATLVTGVLKMNAINTVRATSGNYNHHQVENLRKMLIAMVDDIRVVMIKLAERLAVLRSINHFSESFKRQIATEVMEIYAPLVNRLGIGQLKWEMEDHAFRYLQPEIYKQIAQGLQSRRIDRDKYVTNIVSILRKEISKFHISPIKIYGRSKHIHSIYRKMERKKIDLKYIYDATAVRILVPTIEDCYQALSVVHQLWPNIPEEFDDYIAHPKTNGYRSLHTAVHGPDNRDFEIQIRTHTMHAEAELGIAAHWRYKESGKMDLASHERKIQWLRQVMDWQKELTHQTPSLDTYQQEFIDDCVYVFTPDGDIIDLPAGATPLDFAYCIHSEIGHRCRGAKIDGNIVPLTFTLKTGQRVEILTTKHPKPSLDWLNPHLGYLKTSRAKAKVHQWFKAQAYQNHLLEGKTLLENELKKLNIKLENEKELITAFKFNHFEDLLAALGRGEIKITQILNKLKPTLPVSTEIVKKTVPNQPEIQRAGDFYIEGVGNLLTRVAKCCHPLPGDSIIGYITQGRGIAIHRRECPNILHASTSQQARFMTVSWGKQVSTTYTVQIHIDSYDRKGLLHDVISIVAHENGNVLDSTTQTDPSKHLAHIKLTLEINNLITLSRLLARIKQLPNIIEVKRIDS